MIIKRKYANFQMLVDNEKYAHKAYHEILCTMNIPREEFYTFLEKIKNNKLYKLENDEECKGTLVPALIKKFDELDESHPFVNFFHPSEATSVEIIKNDSDSITLALVKPETLYFPSAFICVFDVECDKDGYCKLK